MGLCCLTKPEPFHDGVAASVMRCQSSSAWAAPSTVTRRGLPPKSHAIWGAAVGHNCCMAQGECFKGRDKEQGEVFCMTPKGVHVQEGQAQKDTSPGSRRGFSARGGSRGEYKTLTKWEKPGEKHKAGNTVFKPIGNYRGGEEFKQTNETSGDTKMTGKFLEKGAGMRRD